MKTTKSILITALFVFAAYGFSYTSAESTQSKSEVTYDKPLIKITVKHAEHIPSLRAAIHQQVSPRIFVIKVKHYYSFHIVSNRDHYLVHGSLNDWKLFFRMH